MTRTARTTQNQTILSGLIEEVPEKQIDSVTSLMGCSIAWYQMVIEAMADGGVKNGVPRALAYKMAAKSMEGSAKLVLETGNAPGVVSPHFFLSNIFSALYQLYDIFKASISIYGSVLLIMQKHCKTPLKTQTVHSDSYTTF